MARNFVLIPLLATGLCWCDAWNSAGLLPRDRLVLSYKKLLLTNSKRDFFCLSAETILSPELATLTVFGGHLDRIVAVTNVR